MQTSNVALLDDNSKHYSRIDGPVQRKRTIRADNSMLHPPCPSSLRLPCSRLLGTFFARDAIKLTRLRRHMKRHASQVHACNQCARWYPHAKNLREHKQTKHQGKRYKCDFPGCPDFVAQKKNLKRHKEKTHSAGPLVSMTSNEQIDAEI
ncbi:hypothetical protein SVAN01_05401 [Stagonosporopsis vannaccii]|nr:hypothetical protein SVAN01_05401 [Stagonosporopsis vannaccii]